MRSCRSGESTNRGWLLGFELGTLSRSPSRALLPFVFWGRVPLLK